MKKYLLAGLFFCCGILFLSSLSSCEKLDPGTKNVTIDESVNAGETYSLELNKYGDRDSRPTIRRQAVHYTRSRIDRDPRTLDYTYSFSIDAKQQEKETVVIELSEDGGGHCNSHDSKTVITINLTVQ